MFICICCLVFFCGCKTTDKTGNAANAEGIEVQEGVMKVIDFRSGAFAEGLGTLSNTTVEVEGLTFFAGESKRIVFDTVNGMPPANPQDFPDIDLTGSVLMNNTGINSLHIAVPVEGPSVLKVYYSSNADSQRSLVLSGTDKRKILDFVTEPVKWTVSLGTYRYEGGPGTLYLSGSGGGIRLFQIEVLSGKFAEGIETQAAGQTGELLPARYPAAAFDYEGFVPSGRIFLAGDSTVCIYTSDPSYSVPRNGWGMHLRDWFKPESSIEIINLALSGRSARSFTAEANYAALSRDIGKGDYLFIQFGHNDEKADDILRYADASKSKETEASFKWFLYEGYIKLAQSKGAIPVLVTPIERREFSGNTVKDTHGIYDDAIRELAAETGVPLIDLTAKTNRLYAAEGPQNTARFHAVSIDGSVDDTHLNAEGALAVSKLVADGIKEANLKIASELL